MNDQLRKAAEAVVTATAEFGVDPVAVGEATQALADCLDAQPVTAQGWDLEDLLSLRKACKHADQCNAEGRCFNGCEATPTPETAQDHRGRPEQRSDPTASEESAAVAADARDAARYRWLREHTAATGLSRFVDRSRVQFLDAAIDAALSTHPAEGERG